MESAIPSAPAPVAAPVKPKQRKSSMTMIVGILIGIAVITLVVILLVPKKGGSGEDPDPSSGGNGDSAGGSGGDDSSGTTLGKYKDTASDACGQAAEDKYGKDYYGICAGNNGSENCTTFCAKYKDSSGDAYVAYADGAYVDKDGNPKTAPKDQDGAYAGAPGINVRCYCAPPGTSPPPPTQ